MTIINSVKSKGAAIALGAILFAGAGLAPVHAQTTADLEAQIQSLLATIASLQAELSAQGGVATTGACAFTRDLTIGATGSDVTCLQTYLIGHGYSIPAGATGYFGTQTQSATAAWQAANGVSPAAGYFGPISRGKYSALIAVTTPTTPTTPSTTLSGGEADLTHYDLETGNDLTAGDTNEEIANASFDVSGGDVNVGRVTLEVQATDTNGPSTNPWLYFDSLSVYDGNTKVGSVDAGSRSDWDSNPSGGTHNASSANYYSIDIPVNDVVKNGDTANLSIRADAQSTIDTANDDQTFAIDIPDNGIRALDAAGIQEYTGDTGDTVTVGFNSVESGDLTVRTSSDNPNAGVLVVNSNTTSDTFDVLDFDIQNRDDADVLVDGITVNVNSASTAANNILRRATLSVNGQTYTGTIGTNTITFNNLNNLRISGNDTDSFTLNVQLASQSGHYNATGESLTFSVPSGNVNAEGYTNGESSSVSGSANGNAQTISLNGGTNVSGTSANTSLTYNSNTPSASYGTFTLKFNVTAVGDDVYVPATAAITTGSTTYAGVIYDPDMDSSTSGGTVTASLTSTADTSGAYGMYVIHAGDSETFTLTVTVNPSADGDFEVGLDKIQFSSTNDLQGLQTLDIDQTQSQFHTDPLHIPNS